MKFSEFKKSLENIEELSFTLSIGKKIPPHFHLTEMGVSSKKFIDCGNQLRTENKVVFQLWEANDYNHRLQSTKLAKIIESTEKILNPGDWEIEVEYQSDTIGKYGLELSDGGFSLTPLHTDCLAKDKCNIPTSKPRINIKDLQNSASCCTPGGGCC